MSSERVYLDYLQDMLDACLKAQNFVANMQFSEFAADEKTQYAVIRALEIIGEAAKKIPSDVKTEFSAIPWRAIAGTRDKMIHDYMGVNIKVVWKTVNEDVPSLIQQIKAILPP